MEYKASLDTLAKGITIGVIVLLLAIGQNSIRVLLNSKGDMTANLLHSGILFMFVAIIMVSWLYAPNQYSIKDHELVINRPIGNVKIYLGDIKEARLLKNDEMNGTIRTFGVGGLFGYFGKFYTPGIGNSTFYVTQSKNRILIITNADKNIIISPDDIEMIHKL